MRHEAAELLERGEHGRRALSSAEIDDEPLLALGPEPDQQAVRGDPERPEREERDDGRDHRRRPVAGAAAMPIAATTQSVAAVVRPRTESPGG